MHDSDEFDLRPYFVAIGRRWRWIVMATLLAAVIVAAVSSTLPKTYTATASALIFIRQTGVQAAPNESLLNIVTIDPVARRQALLALAESTTIEANLPQDVLRQVAPAGYKPGMLVNDDRVRAHAEGDLLEISAKAPSPEQAKQLADAWVTTYVTYVKTMYTDEHSRVELASSALLPYMPSGPRILWNTTIAAVLTALLAVFVVVLFHATGWSLRPLQRRVKREQPANYPSPSR